MTEARGGKRGEEGEEGGRGSRLPKIPRRLLAIARERENKRKVSCINNL